MSKELWIQAHDELIEEYLETNPDAKWSKAYNKCADFASERMADNFADLVDGYRKQLKEEM